MHPIESTTKLFSLEKFNLNLIHLKYNNHNGFLTVNFTTNAFRWPPSKERGGRHTFCPLDSRTMNYR